MQKTDETFALQFLMEEFYMFYWPHGVLDKPTVIVEKPTLIRPNDVLFHFVYGYKSEAEYVNKTEILAVGDNVNGTVRVSGWSGKYRVINQELFDKYVAEGVIELKE